MPYSSRNTEMGDSLKNGDTPDVEMTGVGIDQPDRNGREESSADQVDGHSMSDVSIPMEWELTLGRQDGQATRGYSEGDIHDASQMTGRQLNAECLSAIAELELAIAECQFTIADCQKKVHRLLEHAYVPRDLPHGPDASGPGPSDKSALGSDGDEEMSDL